MKAAYDATAWAVRLIRYVAVAAAFACAWVIILPVGLVTATIVARQHHKRRRDLTIEGRSVVARE